MSSSFKGILSVILSVLFFFPWVWSGILHVKLPALVLLPIGIIAAVIAVMLGVQARKGGSRVFGMAGLTLGVISIILSVFNIIAIAINHA